MKASPTKANSSLNPAGNPRANRSAPSADAALQFLHGRLTLVEARIGRQQQALESAKSGQAALQRGAELLLEGYLQEQALILELLQHHRPQMPLEFELEGRLRRRRQEARQEYLRARIPRRQAGLIHTRREIEILEELLRQWRQEENP